MNAQQRRDGLGRDAFLMTNLVAGRISHELDLVCRAEGITEQQYPVLWVLCLSGADEGLPIGSISDGLVNRASDVSRLVDRLEQAGLVERRRSSDDRRVVLVAPTPAGAAVFERVTAAVKGLHRAQWADLDDAELTTLLGLLNRAFWRSADQQTDEAAS